MWMMEFILTKIIKTFHFLFLQLPTAAALSPPPLACLQIELSNYDLIQRHLLNAHICSESRILPWRGEGARKSREGSAVNGKLLPVFGIVRCSPMIEQFIQPRKWFLIKFDLSLNTANKALNLIWEMVKNIRLHGRRRQRRHQQHYCHHHDHRWLTAIIHAIV